MHKFNTSFVIHFYILGLMSWIWTSPSTDEELKFESPSKWTSYEGFDLEHWVGYIHVDILRFFYIKLRYISWIPLKYSVILLKYPTLTGYFSNSTGLSISNYRLSMITNIGLTLMVGFMLIPNFPSNLFFPWWMEWFPPYIHSTQLVHMQSKPSSILSQHGFLCINTWPVQFGVG